MKRCIPIVLLLVVLMGACGPAATATGMAPAAPEVQPVPTKIDFPSIPTPVPTRNGNERLPRPGEYVTDEHVIWYLGSNIAVGDVPSQNHKPEDRWMILLPKERLVFSTEPTVLFGTGAGDPVTQYPMAVFNGCTVSDKEGQGMVDLSIPPGILKESVPDNGYCFVFQFPQNVTARSVKITGQVRNPQDCIDASWDGVSGAACSLE